jgi:ATP-dependent Clp protease ATP-binding subunit ClpA
MFDDEKALIRVDMSEYMEKHSISKLVGTAPEKISKSFIPKVYQAVTQKSPRG